MLPNSRTSEDSNNPQKTPDNTGVSARKIYDWGYTDPYEGTNAEPGSSEKIRIMQIRAELELPLFHSEDKRYEKNHYSPRRARMVGLEEIGGWWF